MRAAMLVDTKKIETKLVDIPQIDDDEVLIKVKYAGVCGSDLHLFRGMHPFRKPPVILGHEVIGKVVKIGKNVTNISIGDVVTVEPHKVIEECEYSKKGLINIAEHKTAPGTGDWVGTFVEYFNAPEKFTHKLDNKVSFESGVLAEPMAVAVHALNRFSKPEGETLTIIGSGSIGLLATLVAKNTNKYKKIINVDIDDFNLKKALEIGADNVINSGEEDLIEAVNKLTNNKGSEHVLVATGYPEILNDVGKITKKRGEVVLVSMITKNIPYYSYDLVFKELTLIGSMTYTSKDFKETMSLINNGIKCDNLITQKFSLEDSQKALNLLSNKEEGAIKILIDMEK